MLPFSKRHPQSSDSNVVDTGEIEVVRECAPRSVRPTPGRQTINHPISAPRQAPKPPRQTPDSSTHIAASRPRTRRGFAEPVLDDRSELFLLGGQERHATIVPPSGPAYPDELADLAETDDEMTRLMAHRPRVSAMAVSSRRPAPFLVPPAPISTPSISSRSPNARLAMTTPSARRAEPTASASGPRPALVDRTPDSLRPVAFPADVSGRHEPQPTSITLRTHVLTGRPTMTWATALVVLGVFVGLGTSLYGRGDAAASSVSTWLAPQSAAAAAQPQTETAFVQAPQARPAAVTAPVFTSPSPPVADRAASGELSPSDPLAALMDTKGRGDSGSHAQRPTYLAPGSSAPVSAPAHRWVAPSKPAAVPMAPAAPPVALAPAAAPAPAAPTFAAVESAPPPPAAAAPPPPPKSSKGKSKHAAAADADMQAASASDALARAQLEAALR